MTNLAPHSVDLTLRSADGMPILTGTQKLDGSEPLFDVAVIGSLPDEDGNFVDVPLDIPNLDELRDVARRTLAVGCELLADV